MLTLLTPPAAEVIDATDALLRQQLRLTDDDTDENGLIAEMAVAARQVVEQHIQQRLITQTVRLHIDRFPSGAIRVPTAPVQSIAEVQAENSAGDMEVIDAAQFRIETSGPFWELKPIVGAAWPCGQRGWIDLVVGFGDDASDVPAVLRQAVRLHVATQFINREATGMNATELPLGFKDMLQPWRLYL